MHFCILHSVIRGGSRITRWGGGGANPHWRGRQPLTQVLFGENTCKNERIWSCGGGGARRKLLYADLPLVMLGLIKFYTKLMMNTVCNSNLLFIKYIYYTVQVEFCYNVAHMCRSSCSLVELCSLCCPSSK